MIKITGNPLNGRNCIKDELPWITPKSIDRLDKIMKPHFSVLEFGCGGSTLFFSNRVDFVMSYETNTDWAEKVQNIIKQKLQPGQKQNAVISCYIHKQNLIHKLSRLASVFKIAPGFDVIFIDSAWKVVDRDVILKICSDMFPQPKILVLDNYASNIGCPKSWNLDHKAFQKMFPVVQNTIVETYDYKGWGGKGTRIYVDKEWAFSNDQEN